MPAPRSKAAKPPAEESPGAPAEGAQEAQTTAKGDQAPPEAPDAPEESPQEPEKIGFEVARGTDSSQWVPFAGLLAHKPELRDALLTAEEWADELEHFLEPGKFETTDDGQEA